MEDNEVKKILNNPTFILKDIGRELHELNTETRQISHSLDKLLKFIVFMFMGVITILILIYSKT